MLPTELYRLYRGDDNLPMAHLMEMLIEAMAYTGTGFWRIRVLRTLVMEFVHAGVLPFYGILDTFPPLGEGLAVMPVNAFLFKMLDNR